jgi:hypothetical protein
MAYRGTRVDKFFHGVEKRVFAEEWSQLVGWSKFGAKGNGGPGVVVDHAFEIVLSEGLKDVLVVETRCVGHIKQE